MSDEDDTPKYRRRGFLAREISLYHAARLAGRLAQRYGNDDAPISPIPAVSAIRRAPPIRNRFDTDDFNDV